MSLETFFAGLLKDKAGVWDLEQLEKRVTAVEEGVLALNNSPVYDKDFYTAHDYAALLHMAPATVTQNYFRTQKIRASKKDGCKHWLTTADEYRRVEAVVKSKGAWALSVVA